VLELRDVSKLFTRRLDAVERLARALGVKIEVHTWHAAVGASFFLIQGEVLRLFV
jgi:hypothetical protein